MGRCAYYYREGHIVLGIILMAILGLPTCATEDSTDCVWVASEVGNGEGRSFTAVGDKVFFWDDWLPLP